MGLSVGAAREALRADPTLDDLNPVRLAEPTPLVPFSDAARHYASAALLPERNWFDAVRRLMETIRLMLYGASGRTPPSLGRIFC